MRTGGGQRWESLLNAQSNRFMGHIALGNGTQIELGMFLTNTDKLVVSIIGNGAAIFDREVTPEQVSKSLSVKAGDAANLCDFINVQIGVGRYTEKGEYQVKFCAP
jgi:hypothetical protein